MAPIVVKALTPENWLQSDIVPSLLTKYSLNDGYAHLMMGEDWVALFTEPKLQATVPDNVQVLFEAARGSPGLWVLLLPIIRISRRAIISCWRSSGFSKMPFGRRDKP